MTDLHDRFQAEDRLRETAPADDMFGPVIWVEDEPRWRRPAISVERVATHVQQRYRTGGQPIRTSTSVDRTGCQPVTTTTSEGRG